jgi:hypothetical protein
MNIPEFGNYPNRSARARTRDAQSVILTRSRDVSSKAGLQKHITGAICVSTPTPAPFLTYL